MRLKIPLKKNYLKMIRNSEGTKIFQDFYGIYNRKINNLTKGGKLSCAFFVSSILYLFGLIKNIHLGVTRETEGIASLGLLEDMQKSGWFEISRPKIGCVLLWEKKKGHFHIGFYLGNKKAISNSSTKRKVVIHDYKFDRKRKIEKIFWYKKLEE